MSKITVVKHPVSGDIFTPATDGYVKMQIRQEGQILVRNGLVVMSDKVAFPTLQTRVAESPAFKSLKDGDNFPLPGVIQRRMSRVPQFEDQETVKSSGAADATENQINGKPYYSTFIFVADENAPQEIWVDGDGNQITSEVLPMESPEQAAALVASKM